jgi:hypothetical protein
MRVENGDPTLLDLERESGAESVANARLGEQKDRLDAVVGEQLLLLARLDVREHYRRIPCSRAFKLRDSTRRSNPPVWNVVIRCPRWSVPTAGEPLIGVAGSDTAFIGFSDPGRLRSQQTARLRMTPGRCAGARGEGLASGGGGGGDVTRGSPTSEGHPQIG